MIIFAYLYNGDIMATFEEFKEFIKDKPFLKEQVKNGNTSWKELFEHNDLYGKDDELFKKEIINEDDNIESQQKSSEEKETKTDDSMTSFFNLLSGIDVDKISDGLNGMKKILNILSEVTMGDEVSNFSTRRTQKPYRRDDD